MIERTTLKIGMPAPARGQAPARDEKLFKACKDFEAIFTYHLLKTMRRTIDKCDLIHGGQGEEIYESMFDMELSKGMAGLGPGSLADLLYRQLSRVSNDSPVWPAPGTISSEYGWRKDPITGERAFHRGMDVAAGEGSPVRATLAGRVVFSGQRPGFGNVVILDHGGKWNTLYAHNKKNFVQEGQWVEAGVVIAEVGSSGRSTGPHLHFEARRAGESVDPRGIFRVLRAEGTGERGT